MKDGLIKKVNYGLLATFYAPLLTDRQQCMLHMYCDEDYSLSEIAAQLSISRQAVSENLNRAYERLDDLEDQLKIYQSFISMKEKVDYCVQLLSQVVAREDTDHQLKEVIKLLTQNEHWEEVEYGI